MIFSRSAEYAIRGLVHLACLEPGKAALARNIAAGTGLPEPFLAKLLQDLVRDGYLKSNKGPRGGFRLAVAAARIPLFKIVEAIDGPGKYQRCIAGQAECHERVACSMHDSWMPLRARIVEYLQETTIADLAASLGENRRLLVRVQRAPRRSVAANK